MINFRDTTNKSKQTDSMNDHQLLNSIVHMTQERDFESLELALMTTLAEELDVHEISIFKPERVEGEIKLLEKLCLRTSQNPGEEKQLQWDDTCRLPLQNPVVERCFSSKKPCQQDVHAGPSRTEIACPLLKDEHSVGVIYVKLNTIGTNTQGLIHGFTRIHSNYAEVLEDSQRDTLTGLLNRKTFDQRVNNLLEIQSKQKKCLLDISSRPNRRSIDNNDAVPWMIIFDIDHFKRINDSFGHVFGDEVILTIAQLMRRRFRQSDLLFRYGGEEFIVVLSPATAEQTMRIAENFRDAIATHNFPQIDQVTVSIGYAPMHEDTYPRTALESADKALYYAKEHGRNCSYNYSTLVTQGKLTDTSSDSKIDLF
jgi:diguanylate cyclase (GGDEF)-like protein